MPTLEERISKRKKQMEYDEPNIADGPIMTDRYWEKIKKSKMKKPQRVGAIRG